MLIRLLRSHLLGPYRKVLLVVLLLQGVQAMASLYLPSLNADIIDRGIVGRRHRLHLADRRPHAARARRSRSLFTIAAVFFGSRAAMGFGRDVRDELFHRVTDFSAREVSIFGAPSA